MMKNKHHWITANKLINFFTKWQDLSRLEATLIKLAKWQPIFLTRSPAEKEFSICYLTIFEALYIKFKDIPFHT